VVTDWNPLLRDQCDLAYWKELQAFLTCERSQYAIYPPEPQVFAAFELTAYASTRVVILGQDPYHGPGQAHGLCFSVNKGIKIPPSLTNIFKELSTDLGIPPAPHGDLSDWARQGVLLLNTTLTVRQGQAGSHQGHGWERFTNRVIELVNQRPNPVVFVLWGAPARHKASMIDARHTLIESAHPSPLSARRGFFGSRPFSRVNTALQSSGQSPINWDLGTGTSNTGTSDTRGQN
jgi:uracil-DNA glycosylase